MAQGERDKKGKKRDGKGAVVAKAVIAIMALVVAVVAIVAGLVWASIFKSVRGDVSGVIRQPEDGMPVVSYQLTYESGSYESKCYEALASDFESGKCPPSWAMPSWGLLPAREEEHDNPGEAISKSYEDPPDQTSDMLSKVARKLMLDNPKYASYLRGDLAMDVMGNRYRPHACDSIGTDELLDRYDKIESYLRANSALLQANAESSDAKYACIAYRFLSETVSYSSTSESNDVASVIDSGESGALGLALSMKGLLDADGIPNYIAYGTFVDTGFQYVWNVAWVNDSWSVFDVPAGAKAIAEAYPMGTDGRWAIDRNIASIPILLEGCMVHPEDYAEQAVMDDECSELQLRYEALVSNNKVRGTSGTSTTTDGDAGKGPTYQSLLSDADLRFYDSVSADFVSWRQVNEDDFETWFVSPVNISSDADCDHLAEIAACAMYDNPVLSVTNGGGGWTMRWAQKKTDYGDISRYFISSPISSTDGDVETKLETTNNIAHDFYMNANAEAGGDERKFVYAAYRDISADCLYSDDIDDTVHHNDAYGALVEGESKCYGVSCAMKMVLDEKGIANFVAFGRLNGEAHAWNMVFIGGRWYGCDLTYGSMKAKEDYADGTLNREILYAGINEMDTFYDKCMVDADKFYAPSGGIEPSELSRRLQESYRDH